MWDLWWTKRHWGSFFSKFFGFSLSISFHLGSHSYIICGMNSRPVGGCSSETQSHPIDMNMINLHLLGKNLKMRAGQQWYETKPLK
jgi:hypothetical protein